MRAWVWSSWALLTLVAACKRDAAPAADSRTSVPPPASAEALPVDSLAPGELVEGTEQAFGVTLPRALLVERSFADVVYASGPVSVHQLAKYFQRRLEDGSLHEGDATALFEHVRVRGKPGQELSIRITGARSSARAEIRDATPPPAPNLPDEAARWRQVGLTPNGKLADPTHLD